MKERRRTEYRDSYVCSEKKRARSRVVENRETRRINGERSGTEAKVKAGMHAG